MNSTPMGARIVCGFAGTKASDAGVSALRMRVKQGHVAGVVLFSYNIESPRQLKELISELRSWALPPSHGPLLVMVDQEGGRVQRLTAKKGFVASCSPAAFAELSDDDKRNEAAAMAEQLAFVGINVNLAPCCDMAIHSESVIGRAERSFGETSSVVEACARIVIEEHAKRGIATVLKHFPGLGGARGDTHAGLIDATADWRDSAIGPFATLASEHPLVALMSTHMVNRVLEPSGEPLTFSSRVMHDLLRHKVSSHLVSMTDDLGMGAMQKHFALNVMMQKALLAGHDLLMFGENEAALGDGRPPRHVPIDELYDRVCRVADAITDEKERKKVVDESAARLTPWRDSLRAAATE